MRTLTVRTTAAALALVATTSVVAGIQLLAKKEAAVAVVQLPLVEIVATRPLVETSDRVVH
jgi:uncharacterized membrane protein YvlD (DUF360 family)